MPEFKNGAGKAYHENIVGTLSSHRGMTSDRSGIFTTKF